VPDLARLERFLAAIGQQEDAIFRERTANEAEFQARRRKFAKRDGAKAGDESEAEQRAREGLAAEAFEAAMAAQASRHTGLGRLGKGGVGSSCQLNFFSS
jgi:5'-3' exonuclease